MKFRQLRVPALASLICTAVCLCPTILHGQTPSSRNSPQSTRPVSLKGKSDAELLQLITGSTKPVVQKPDRFYDDDQVTPSPLDRLWEMDPKEAALAFAVDAVSESMKGLTLKIALEVLGGTTRAICSARTHAGGVPRGLAERKFYR